MADMHICDRCGKPTPNYSKYISGPIGDREGYSVCDDCIKQRDRERAWENELWHRDEITCPWCGYLIVNEFHRGFFHGATCGGSSSDFDLCDACSARVQRFIEERPREKAAKDV